LPFAGGIVLPSAEGGWIKGIAAQGADHLERPPAGAPDRNEPVDRPPGVAGAAPRAPLDAIYAAIEAADDSSIQVMEPCLRGNGRQVSAPAALRLTPGWPDRPPLECEHGADAALHGRAEHQRRHRDVIQR